MEPPRHRFRREDLESEPSTEGMNPVDVKLLSIEEDLKTFSQTSAMQARDNLALRARVETLEARGGGDVETTLTKVFDHLEAQDDRVEQLFDRLQVLERRLQEVGQRLDSVGEFGRLENLPGLLDQSLVKNLDDLEDRIENRLVSLEAGGGGSAEDVEAIKKELQQKNQSLRTELDRLLESRHEELLEMVQETARGSDTDELKASIQKDMDLIRTAVAELQEATEAAPSRADLELMKGQMGEGADSAEVQELKKDVGEVRSAFTRLREQLGSIKTLFGGEGDWTAKLQKSVEEVEGHQERVDLAIRLVKQLEESGRGGGGGGGGGGAGIAGDLVPPEGESQLKLTLKDLVREMVKNRVSDLHIKTGRAITARIGKELIQFSTPPLTPADTYQLISTALRATHRKRLVEERDVEFVYQYESVRLRANAFFDRGNLSATFKMLSNRPPELENLGLPKAFSGMLGRGPGLILVCGLPGSGRTTTLTASLDFLNRTRQLHLVSLEDRLDFTHEDRRSLVTQRELGSDIVSFGQGLRRAAGQDCDVAFVADLSDKDTMEAAFAAVESGLLVVGCITSQNAEGSIPRLINLFPESERKMRARIFARSLKAILSLKLFQRADGEGQVPASELLIANPTVKRLIEDANLSALQAQVARGGGEGMQTFVQSVERLLDTGLIAPDVGQRELERLGAPANTPRVGGTPAKPATAAPPAPQRPPAAPAPRPDLPAAGGRPPTPPPEPAPAAAPEPAAGKQPEAFGEEDTLMNWL